MKYLVILFLIISCQVKNGKNGRDGHNGFTSLIRSYRTSISGCESSYGVIVENGVDYNRNGILDSGELTTGSFICDGRDGYNGEDGKSATDITFIDPCGQQGDFDEVIIRFGDSLLLGHYSDNKKQFLTNLIPGIYITTDGTNCQFEVSDSLEIISLIGSEI